jgi:hypothetical protein
METLEIARNVAGEADTSITDAHADDETISLIDEFLMKAFQKFECSAKALEAMLFPQEEYTTHTLIVMWCSGRKFFSTTSANLALVLQICEKAMLYIHSMMRRFFLCYDKSGPRFRSVPSPVVGLMRTLRSRRRYIHTIFDAWRSIRGPRSPEAENL